MTVNATVSHLPNEKGKSNSFDFIWKYVSFNGRAVGRRVAGMARATPTFGRNKPESTVQWATQTLGGKMHLIGHPNFKILPTDLIGYDLA